MENGREMLEKAYYDLYKRCVRENDKELWDTLHALEDGLASIGIIEGKEVA